MTFFFFLSIFRHNLNLLGVDNTVSNSPLPSMDYNPDLFFFWKFFLLNCGAHLEMN